MLSSQVAVVSPNSTLPALLQSSTASSMAMLRSSGTLPRRSRPHHQIRTLRIGLWSSYLDPYIQKEGQRRHRIMKHKYIESLNTKLSWECHNYLPTRHLGFKGFMCSAWRGQDPKPVNGGQQKTSRGIEDVEQNALDKLLDSGVYDRLRATSRIWLTSANYAINPLVRPSTVQKDSPNRPTYGQEGFPRRIQIFSSQQTPGPDSEYEIDPITNRKVFKNKSSKSARQPIEVPVKTFKGYRSQLHGVFPPASQPTESEIKTHTSSSESSSESADPARKSLEDYERDRKYKPFFRYEPDGQKPESKNESLSEYDRKASYETSRWYEPEVPIVEAPEKACPVQEGLKDYDNKAHYGPVLYREPDGKLPEKSDGVRESLEEYEIKHPIGPVRYREPDGKLPETPCPVQEGLKDYDSKVTYGNARPSPSKQDTAARGLRDFAKGVNHYRTRIMKNVFSGSGNGGADKSFRYSEEDTKEDMDLLRPSDVRAASGIIKGAKKESDAEKLAMRSQLEEDFQKQQDKTMEDLKIETSELRNIQAHLRGRVNAELANVSADLSSKTPRRKMTGNFVIDFPEEFETRWTSAQDSGALKPEHHATIATKQEAHESAPKALFARDSNTPRIETSLDRTAGNTREKAKTDEMARLQNKIDPYSKEPQGLETSYAEEVKLQNEIEQDSKKATGLETNSEGVAWERSVEVETDSKTPQGLETSSASKEEQERKLELERDPYSKVPQGLETSYSEEVKLRNEKDPYSKKPMGLETSYAEEIAAQQAEGDLSVLVSSFGNRNESEDGTRASKLAKQERKDFLKQKDKDLIREIRNICEELDSKHRHVPESPATTKQTMSSESSESTPVTSEAQNPTVYKILAYDPTMQEINIAETTSIVTDTASALTPAEVLLRLSNPAKFFPHFQPLQNEGYEIVSGSGDVLVFRKVRSAAAQGSRTGSAFSHQDAKRNAINPIDGMQSSPIAATGNFASPTGFVNHDLPVSDDPPFKSNIDVRREEPVFSGKSNWEDDSGDSPRRKSKGRAKRILIGMVWLAGCSYAIGVVAEFFRTGGMDGRGPQGF